MIEPGQRVGKYVIERRLGAGGMGEVYRAHDASLERPVAIKVLPESDELSPEARARMLREARAASALRHPNIVTVHEVGEDRGRSYLVMELIEGETLAELIRRRGPLPPAEAVGLVVQVGAALTAAHDAGFLHRDVKTSNLMLDGHGIVKVLDFGLAKRAGSAPPRPAPPAPVEPRTVPGRRGAGGGQPVDADDGARAGADPGGADGDGGDVIELVDRKGDQGVDGTAPTMPGVYRPPLGDDLTVAGTGMGTAGCSAPELMDGQSVDHRADVFSLGVVLYELVTGRRPFDARSWDEIRKQIGAEEYPTARTQGVPAAVDAVIARALRPQASTRWSSVAEMIDALQAAVAPRGRGPWPAIGAAVAIGVAGGAAYAVYAMRRGGTHAPAHADGGAAVVPSDAAGPAPWSGPPATPTRLAVTRSCAQAPVFVGDDALVFEMGEAGDTDLWRLDLTTGAAAPLVESPAAERAPAAAPEPGQVLFLTGGHPAGRAAIASADLASGVVRRRVEVEAAAVAAVGADLVYVPDRGRELRRVRGADDEPLIQLGDANPLALAAAPDGIHLAMVVTGGEPARACIVDLSTDSWTCPVTSALAARADLGRDGALYFATADGVRRWDGAAAGLVATGDAQGGIAVSPSGRTLVLTGCGTIPELLDVATRPPTPLLDDEVTAIAVGPGQVRARVVAGTAVVIDRPGLAPARHPGPTGARLDEVDVTADGARVVAAVTGSGSDRDGLYQLDVTTGAWRQLTRERTDSKPRYLADGTIVFSRARLDQPREVLRLTGDGEPAVVFRNRRLLAVAAGAGLVLTATDDDRYVWWDPGSDRQTAGPEPPPGGGRRVDVALAPGGGWYLFQTDTTVWRRQLVDDGGDPPPWEEVYGAARPDGLLGLAVRDDGHPLVIEPRVAGTVARVDAPDGRTW